MLLPDVPFAQFSSGFFLSTAALPHCKSVNFLPCSVELTSPAWLIPAGTSPAPLNAFASALFVKIQIHFTPLLILEVSSYFQWREPVFTHSL